MPVLSGKVTSLPFKLDVEVGGNTPPRMLYMERSVQAK
jgi:hypothetical protein